ncbi:MAG: rod shape-determining protein RodA [Pseudomonadota bacterium]|nr:rod shape-determining protein RodA [Pseudomonadota bacterium]
MIKIFYLNWPLILLIATVASFGFLILYSVAEGDMVPWAKPQMIRFAIGFSLMIIIAFTHIDFWRRISILIYIGSVILLLLVLSVGDTGMGAKRWIDLKIFRLQPSETMKLGLVMMLALYYDWLKPEKVSKPFWVLLPLIMIILPAGLVIRQPDLGTGLLIAFIGISVMFLAGVSGWYFSGGLGLTGIFLFVVWVSRNTPWQFLKDYQYRRIDTFLNPSLDPLGSGYHITQSKIALGSGGLTGRGFMQGTQSQLNFLPEKHTDFIFTTLAEEFGFLGAISLLAIYGSIVIFSGISAIVNRSRYGSLLTSGLTITFFSYFSVNIAMVTGLAPVVGVPLPLISYGGSAMLVLLLSFGLIQSAHVHKPRTKTQ